MQLAAEGRKVVWRFKGGRKWIPGDAGNWDWPECDFAIIAEPVAPDEVWVNVVDADVLMDVYATQAEAEAALNRGWEAVRYRRAD